MKCYINYLDSKNNFKQTRKEFNSYEEAVSFLKSTFEKYNLDMINYIF